MGNAIHILRYGTNGDQKSIKDAEKTFDYLAINANMVAHSGAAIARFICLKLHKPYFIDPLTYAFQANIDLLYSNGYKKDKDGTIKEVKFKSSIKKMVQSYSVFQPVLDENRPISIAEMENENNQSRLCQEVMEFQLQVLTQMMEKDETIEYLEYGQSETDNNFGKQLEPKWVIAPYFHIDTVSDRWLDVNLKLAEIAMQVKKKEKIDQPVLAEILLNKEILKSKEDIRLIAEKYKKTSVDGFVIWIDGLNEMQCEQDELEGFILLLETLGDRPKYNMYGGYFSTILTHKDVKLLDGVSHGLEYGESRSAYPVGGGIPTSKYYLLPLHQRLDFQSAFNFLKNIGVIDIARENWGDSKKYFSNICACPMCKEIIVNGMIDFSKFQGTDYYEVHYKTHTSRRIKANKDTKQYCRLHYLSCKKMEFIVVERKSIEYILQKLKEDYLKYQEEFEESIQYLQRWYEILKARG